MSRHAITAILGALAWLAAAIPVQAAGESLSGEQVRALISGNTVSGAIYAKPYEFSYTADGKIYGEIGSTTDSGNWLITEDGRYCHEWTNFFEGVRRCYKWQDIGGGRQRMINVDTFRIRNIDVWRIRPGTD